MALASSSSGTLLDLRAIFFLSVVVAAAEGAVATGGAGEGAGATRAGAGAGGAAGVIHVRIMRPPTSSAADFGSSASQLEMYSPCLPSDPTGGSFEVADST